MRHPFGPAGSHRAAPALGRPVARGSPGRDGASGALPDASRGSAADPSGPRARPAHAPDDAARAVRRAACAGIEQRRPRRAPLQAAGAAAPDGRSARQILVEALGVTEGQAAGMTAAWRCDGLLRVVDRRDPARRKGRRGLAVDAAGRPTFSLQHATEHA